MFEPKKILCHAGSKKSENFLVGLQTKLSRFFCVWLVTTYGDEYPLSSVTVWYLSVISAALVSILSGLQTES